MIDDYDFLCGNDFTLVKIAFGNDDYHTIRVQAELATTIDFSGGLRNITEIIIDRCTKFHQIKWPENARGIKRLKIGNSSNLESLDLLGLVNLEELSIVNCKKLTKINGLGGEVKSINIQGCKLDSLELSRCKKIKNFILTTQESNLNLNFSHSAFLHSVVINLEATKGQKTGNIYGDSRGKVDCTFNHCAYLNSLAINSPNIPTNIDITGCTSLKTGLFLVGENAQITGESTCTQLDAALDFDNKKIEIDSYTVKNKKNALKMPENLDDVETIIQQNGVFRKKNKACLAKLQLLMRPRRNSYIYTHNKYVMNHCKFSSVDMNFIHSESEFKNESAVLQQENKWWNETFANPIEQKAKSQYQYMEMDQLSFINQPGLWNNYLKNIHENKYKKIDKLKLAVPQKQKKHLNNNPIFVANEIFNEAFINTNYDLAYDKNNKIAPLFTKPLIPINDLKKAGLINKIYYPVIGPKKIDPISRFLIKDLKFAAYEEGKKSGKKDDPSPSSDLSGSAKTQAEIIRQEATPVLAPEENENSNLSDLELKNKQIPKNNITGLIAAPAAAGYEDEKSNLSTLDIKEESSPQEVLAPAEKAKANTPCLKADPLLVGYVNEITSLLSLDPKGKLNSQGALTPAEKIKSDAKDFTADPLLADYVINTASLSSLDIKGAPGSQGVLTPAKKINADAQYIKADPELVKYEFETSSLFALDIKEKLVSQGELTEAKKVKIEAEYLTANAVYDKSTQSELINEDIDYRHHVARALVDLKPRDSELLSDEFNSIFLTELNERLNKEIKDIQNNQTSQTVDHEESASNVINSEDINYTHHVVRALVDLKPHNPDLFDDDFNSFYLSEINERINKGIKEIQDNLNSPSELIPVGKVKAENQYITVDPLLVAYEREETFLTALNIKAGFASQDDLIRTNQEDTESFIESYFEQNESDSEEDNIEYSVEETEFDALRELLIECDLLDEVLNDESGTLLQYMLEKTSKLEWEQRDFEIDFDSLEDAGYQDDLIDAEDEFAEDEAYESELTEFDDFELLDEAPQASDHVMSDEMIELLNIMTDEEMELLFPKGKKPSTNKAYFDALQVIVNKPELEINLKNIVPEHVKKLLQFFDSQEKSGIKAWEKGVTYAFADGTEFTFKNDVFQRARKAGHEGVRYETVSNKMQLGEGGFGKVRRIKGTVSLDVAQEEIHFKKRGTGGKRRVVKIQQHTEDANPLSQYQEGFVLAKRATHLAIKEPTVVDRSLDSQTSYTVMNEVAGREFFDIRADDYEGIDVLSTQERIDLTNAMLVALKEQVTEQGLVHRDIKPENIMVDLGPPIGVKIIDYDMSMDTPDGEALGTEGYYAPEMISDPMSTSAKSDVYSMARVIALIWRVDLATYIENEDYPYTPHLFIPEDTLFGIFDGIYDLSEEEKICIERTLTGMLENDPNQRFSIDEAIDSFAFLGTGEEITYWNDDPANENFESDSFSSTADFDELELDNLEDLLPDDAYESDLLDSYDVYNAMEFDDLEFLDEASPLADNVMGDEMIELLNIMTDEEMELLFPKGKKTSTNKAYFDALQGIVNKPELEINLKNIDLEHVKKLLQFFDSQEKSGIKSWEKGVTYAFADGTEFTFKNDVFQRARKAGHEGVRYETISNKKQLGEGGFGKVKRIKGTVSLDATQEAIHFKKRGTGDKRRVVKIQQHTDDANSLSHYQEGFVFAKRAVHLAIKEPTVVDRSLDSQTSYTVMNEVAGREFFDISADDYEGIDVLSTQERIDLTKAMLVALKEQVTEQGLVHRDIKPENIMVDLGPPIGVNIIDYDMSMDTPDGASVGTEGYYAPEMISDPMNTSGKSDVYSMARVIALIWRVDLATYIENEDIPYTPELFIPEDTLFGIFDGINDLSEEEKICIERTLTGMLENDPNQRFSIDEAIASFASVGVVIEKEWNIDEILDWFAAVDTSTLPTTEILATLGLMNASNYSRDDTIVYNKEQITPLLRLIEENLDPQIVRQTMRVLFTIPFQWIEDNEVKFDPSKPAMFFQLDAKDRAEVLNEVLKNSETKQILFEELFLPENIRILEIFNDENINGLVLNDPFFEKKRSGYSSSFFQKRPEEYQLISQNDSKNQLIGQILSAEQDQDALKSLLKSNLE